jgi:hypothetical protein
VHNDNRIPFVDRGDEGANISSVSLGSDSLFWVVETNLHDRSFAIVRIYDRQNIKVYEVRLKGEFIDIRNPKHRKKLDSMIKQISEQAAARRQRRQVRLFENGIISRGCQLQNSINKTIEILG